MLYLTILWLPLLVSTSYAIVCTPEICKNVNQKPLNCAGDIIQGGGFCGCTDICAGTEGARCQTESGSPPSRLFGVPPPPACSSGYECVALPANGNLMSMANGVCRKTAEGPTTRAAPSECEIKRRGSLLSMAIWGGKWTPTCNADGSYSPKQCEFSGACWCVTPEGKMVVGSKKAPREPVLC